VVAPDVGFYDVVHRRRDVRGEFTGEVVPTEVLHRILDAAHTAPSVGLSQPWDFVLIRDVDTRTAFRDHVQAEREISASQLDKEQSRTFARIKIEGILESSLGIVVTYDSRRGSPAVLGRHAIADAGLYSVCLAIENLWLADGSASTGKNSCGNCWASPASSGRWPGCAWARSGPCRPSRTSNATAGDTASRWPRSCTRSGSDGQHTTEQHTTEPTSWLR
jgi:5,6-dimethylbenzimidazole synthase